MSGFVRSRRRRLLAAAAFAALALGAGQPDLATAEGMVAPAPTIVIYPGDVIRDDMLTDVRIEDPGGAAFAPSREAVVGKTSRRTLLPGRPIPMAALAARRIVRNGAAVELILIDGGLQITAGGQALQDGGLGDSIKCLNSGSGVIVSGVVQADGTVRVRS